MIKWVQFFMECKWVFFKHRRQLIRSWPGIFILFWGHKRAGYLHLLPSFTKAESCLKSTSEIILKVISVGRRWTGSIFREIVFLAKSEVCCSYLIDAFRVIKFITSSVIKKLQYLFPFAKPNLFGEGVQHFSSWLIWWTVTYLIAIAYCYWHLSNVPLYKKEKL